MQIAAGELRMSYSLPDTHHTPQSIVLMQSVDASLHSSNSKIPVAIKNTVTQCDEDNDHPARACNLDCHSAWDGY